MEQRKINIQVKKAWESRRRKRLQKERKLEKVPSLPCERWRYIVGLEGDYMVSNFARIKRLSRSHANVHGEISVKAEKLIKYS